MLEAKFYETYYFCNVIRNILYDQFEYIRDLNEFYGDDAYLYLVSPFEKYSTFHKFIEFIVDDIFYENTSSINLSGRQADIERFADIPTALEDMQLEKLPVELALDFHNIEHEGFCSYLQDIGKTFISCDEDDIYDYLFELRNSSNYEKLVDQTVKEVFHILFQNRDLMLIFNNMMSGVLARQKDNNPPAEFKHLFAQPGVLTRKTIPGWVQRAVFFRDRGRCVLCDKDLSGTINFRNIENYDHIVPLKKNGLNDVTNIQLLCKECNQIEKKDGDAVTSGRYQSWYTYD